MPFWMTEAYVLRMLSCRRSQPHTLCPCSVGLRHRLARWKQLLSQCLSAPGLPCPKQSGCMAMGLALATPMTPAALKCEGVAMWTLSRLRQFSPLALPWLKLRPHASASGV